MPKKKKSPGPSVYRISMGDDYRGSRFVSLSLPGGKGRETRQYSVSVEDAAEALLWPDEIPALEARGFAVAKIKGTSPNPTLTFKEDDQSGEADGGE